MFGWLILGAFIALIVSYASTELLLRLLRAHFGLIIVGRDSLLAIVTANALVWAFLAVSGFALCLLFNQPLYLEAVIISFCAQVIWLVRQLLIYRRDFLRISQQI